MFITLVSSGNAASFVAAMKDFGPIQTMTATKHPSLLKFWQWGRPHQPNREPMLEWAEWRLRSCSIAAKDCSLTGSVRLDLSGARLLHADLAWATLYGANLSGADLYHAT